MFKTLTSAAALALVAAPLALAGTQNVDVRGFDRIETKGAMNVVYKAGPQTSVVIETDGDDFSDADVSVDGDKLVIARKSLNKRGLFGGSASLRISDGGKTVKVNGKKVPYYTVHVTSPELSAIRVSQSSRADVSGVDAGSFEASTSSAAKLRLSGRASSADISVSSSGEIEAADFLADALTASASSSGDLTATVAGPGDVKISASSSGDVSLRSLQPAAFTVNASSGADVELAGACSSIRITASSGADVEADKLTCETAKVNVSSGADVDAFASVSADGNASSGGSISFSGRPAEQQASRSSGGSVKFN